MTRRELLKYGLYSGVAAGLLLSQRCVSKTPQTKTNVLFIAIDDLRPELGCYGQKHIHSPNIDRFASRAIRFDRAYCQAPACGPSRSSLLSGIHPNPRNANIWNIDKFAPNVVTLPQAFREAGYYTISNSKIFHGPEQAAERSWSETPTGHDNHLDFFDPASKNFINPRNKRGPFFEAPDVPNETYLDGQTCAKSLKDLRRLTKMEQPFFLAVGFVRPHLPFYAPQKYWDLYDEDTITIADNRYPPKNKPAQLKGIYEFNSYHYRGFAYNSKQFHRKARHGYYACVSYIDSLVGRLLDELDRLNIRDNTTVVLWGDHGWQLGEHNYWSKANLLDRSTRLPLIISPPGGMKGTSTNALVELVDIYPTLLQMAGIEKPDHLTGVSLVPLLKNPEMDWKDATFSWWKNGRTIHTSQHTYTEWIKDDQVVGRMLFDHKTDPQENINIADLPENENLVKQLSRQLKQGFKQALPKN